MYGIGPTHREEVRRREKFRLFLEERLLELRDIFLYTLEVSKITFGVLGLIFRACGTFIMENIEVVALGIIVTVVLLLFCY